MSDYGEDYKSLERHLREAGTTGLIKLAREMDADLKRELRSILEASENDDDESSNYSLFAPFGG